MNLTTEETRLLAEILGNQKNVLRIEINRTDSLEFKEDLKKREALLESVIQKCAASIEQPLPEMKFVPGARLDIF